MKSTVEEMSELVKKLKDECFSFLDEEKHCQDFSTAIGTDIESTCPVCDYESARLHLSEIEKTIHILKQIINQFEMEKKTANSHAEDQ